MNELNMARALMGSNRTNPGQTTTAYGVAASDSVGGLVMVDMGGDTVSPDDDQSIECETTFKVYEGDEVIVSLIGADGSGKTPIVTGVVGRGDEENESVQQRARDLDTQIRQNATEINQRITEESDTRAASITEIDSKYGSITEELSASIALVPGQIRESYWYQEMISTVGDLEQYLEVVDGEIKRGFIDLPDNTKAFGIVVSSRNVFSVSGETYTPPGESNVYYKIADTGECFGLYTATGWQFWNGSNKLAWFDTGDGQLHVNNIKIDASLTMGPWRLSYDGTNWGLKYIGA